MRRLTRRMVLEDLETRVLKNADWGMEVYFVWDVYEPPEYEVRFSEAEPCAIPINIP